MFRNTQKRPCFTAHEIRLSDIVPSRLTWIDSTTFCGISRYQRSGFESRSGNKLHEPLSAEEPDGGISKSGSGEGPGWENRPGLLDDGTNPNPSTVSLGGSEKPLWSRKLIR